MKKPIGWWIAAVSSCCLGIWAGCSKDARQAGLRLVFADEDTRNSVTQLTVWALDLRGEPCDPLLSGRARPEQYIIHGQVQLTLPATAALTLPALPGGETVFFAEGKSEPGVVMARGCSGLRSEDQRAGEVTITLARICYFDPAGEKPSNQRDDDCDGLVDECESDAECDDHNPCTRDSCVAQACLRISVAEQSACEDGNPCTRGDFCVQGACQAGPSYTCLDGDPCTRNVCVGDGTCSFPPGECGCKFRKPIRVDQTRVSPSGGSDLQNFPMLVHIPSDPLLRSKSNGGNVEHDSGSDLLFLRSADQGLLDHEVERYDPATGELLAWVRVPLLSASTDTVFYLYYGCPDIAASRQNPAGVWRSGYRGVWHLDGDGQAMLDSTSFSNDVSSITNVSFHQTGEIGSAVAFAGDGSMMVSDQDSLDVSQFTVSAWIKLNRTDVLQMALSKGVWGDTIPFELGLEPTAGWLSLIDPGGSPTVLHSAMPVSGQWYHVLARYTGTELSLWVNGAQVNQESVFTTLPPNTYPLAFGDSAGAGAPLDGMIDEARICGEALSDDWIQTGYASEGDPATFYTLGPQETR